MVPEVLTGLLTSEYKNSFALANAQNCWITEAGSLFYSVYHMYKSRPLTCFPGTRANIADEVLSCGG